MKKTFLLDLAVLTLLFGTLGCDFAKGGHKPLIGSIRQTVEACAVNDTETTVRKNIKYKAPAGDDRGHMCPSGDNKWDKTAQQQSFLMTNICPQNRNLNAGDWNEMENQCRKWAKQYGRIYIVAGPILYNQKHKTIGKAKVVVPEAFFKVVLCMEGTPKAIGFIYKNEAGNRPKGDYVNSIDAIERITGFDFFPALEDALEAKVEAEANLADW